MTKQGFRVLGCKKTHPKSSQSLCRGFFVCRWFGVATSKHKQFILTHKDTFSRSHLTKQPTGNRTDTSLSALRSPFSEIATPAVIKPGSCFLCFCCLNSRKGLWVRTGETVGNPPSHLRRQQEVSAPTSSSVRANAEVARVLVGDRSLSVLYMNLFVVLFLPVIKSDPILLFCC